MGAQLAEWQKQVATDTNNRVGSMQPIGKF